MDTKRLVSQILEIDELIDNASKEEISAALKITVLIIEKYSSEFGEISPQWLRNILEQEQLDDLDESTLNLILAALQRLEGILSQVTEGNSILH